MIDHMLLHCIVNGQLGYPGFQAGDVMRSDRFWPDAAARLVNGFSDDWIFPGGIKAHSLTRRDASQILRFRGQYHESHCGRFNQRRAG